MHAKQLERRACKNPVRRQPCAAMRSRWKRLEPIKESFHVRGSAGISAGRCVCGGGLLYQFRRASGALGARRQGAAQAVEAKLRCGLYDAGELSCRIDRIGLACRVAHGGLALDRWRGADVLELALYADWHHADKSQAQ